MALLDEVDFGNEAGDDIEASDITDLFVEQLSFDSYLNFDNKIKLITGKKGVGKSLLLQWLNLKFNKKSDNVIIIKCRGADLTRNEFNLKNEIKSPNDYIKDWMIRLSAIANRAIAQLIKFPLNDDQLTLLETSELQGYKQKNLFSCLLSRFKVKIDKLPIEIDYEPKAVQNELEILKRNPNKKIVFLIDDLDATFQNNMDELLSLSTFFTACRYLSQDVKDVFFRITLRTDVWPLIRRYDEALDKIDQYVEEIVWTVQDFRTLLSKRIQKELKRRGQNYVQRTYQTEEEFQEFIISQAFVNKMDWGEFGHYTYRVLFTLSYKRPRWAIQLCKLAQIAAKKRKDEKIDKIHIDLIWGEYGNKRIADLVSEHKHQCSSVNELINAFRGSERLLTRDELIKTINNKIIAHLNVMIDGNKVNSPLEIGYFLYRIGFFVGRSDDANNYEHYSFDQLPDLLTNRTNDDFKLKWEIHPCYREALDIKKIDKYNRIKRGYIRE
ncbi:MAG: hypothetical protein LBD31_07745 [Treponema sp.]|nr:hypothetical protein [Treponema sp.]